jgi:hypothetical protein
VTSCAALDSSSTDSEPSRRRSFKVNTFDSSSHVASRDSIEHVHVTKIQEHGISSVLHMLIPHSEKSELKKLEAAERQSEQELYLALLKERSVFTRPLLQFSDESFSINCAQSEYMELILDHVISPIVLQNAKIAKEASFEPIYSVAVVEARRTAEWCCIDGQIMSLRIPYNQIMDVIAISESALIMGVLLHYRPDGPDDTMHGHASLEFPASILVGPCPSWRYGMLLNVLWKRQLT